MANPLVLFHLVSGIHSEALMMGLLAAGLEVALAALPRLPGGEVRWWAYGLGVVLVTASALVKLPSIVALGFVALALARSRGRARRHVLPAGLLTTAIAGLFTLAAVAATGAGAGWITKLGAATSLRSWLSPPTALGVLSGGICQYLGLGDHTEQILAMTQAAGLVLAGVWTLRMLWATFTKTIDPVGGFGLAMAGIVVCFPVVQPWYLLWALIPLSAWANRLTFRVPVVVVSALLACFTLPTGAGLPPYVTVQSWVATAVIVAVAGVVLLWRPGPLRESRAGEA